MILKPLTTEKAVKMLEIENTLIFQASRTAKKADVKKEIESLFKVKVDKVRVLLRDNKKNFFIKLNKKNPAADLASKLGMI